MRGHPALEMVPREAKNTLYWGRGNGNQAKTMLHVSYPLLEDRNFFVTDLPALIGSLNLDVIIVESVRHFFLIHLESHQLLLCRI